MTERRDRVLVVDDDPAYARALQVILERQFDVQIANSLGAAVESLQYGVFHGILLDIRLGGARSSDTDGLTLLRDVKQERPLMPVVMMTAVGSVSLAVEAMKLGADDFVEKGQVDSKRLVRVLVDVLRRNREQLQIQARAADQAQREPFEMVGHAQAMQPVRRAIEIAAGDGFCSVLVTGETGTGKEVVARAIHQTGQSRHEGPFVAVPTPGLSESLVESELFGHEKGAFTGAADRHIGFIERADGGVLFLDEIGDLTPQVQVKLLRFLEERVLQRVGSTRGRPVDVQVVAATHQDLQQRVSSGEFRRDLYYRLNTVEIQVPPLRARREDIPLLADHFLQLMRRQGRTKLAGFSPEATETLAAYHYPGNVRELRNIVESSVLSASHAAHWVIEHDDLAIVLQQQTGAPEPAAVPETGGDVLNVDLARSRAELACVSKALVHTGGRKSEARELLGYPNRQTMRRRIQQLRERYPDVWDQFPVVRQAYDNEPVERT